MKLGRKLVILAMATLAISAALAAVGCGGGERGATTARPAAGKPAVILIAVDGLRADRLWAHGGAVATPSLDALAGAGVRFDWCFAQAPDPAASFASLLTGLYPTTSGVLEAGDRLPDAAVSLADALSAAGLSTAAFVEGAPGGDDFGLRQGFSVFEMSADPGTAARQWLRGHAGEGFLLVIRGWSVGLDAPAGAAVEGVEPPAGFAERVQAVLASAGTDSPAAFEPADLDYLRLFYARRVVAADLALGELRAELEQLGVAERVTLIVTGTAGLDLGQHGPTGAQSLHATVTRVPLLASIAGGRGAGQAVDKIVELVDVMPTILELQGVALPAGVQGASLLPMLDGTARPPYVAFSEAPGLGRQRAVALGGLHLVRPLDGGAAALFDLAADPAEFTDIAAANPDKVAVMERQLDAWGKMVAAASLDPELKTAEELDDATLDQLRSLGYIQ
ncbi:MAG TPA: sulfatase-like hydrolase/transferase [Thermoanaerobaculales bacterium]|nr:sulfatase-like hydrolase/transferase [Thermoanaerobaculales bacterium]HPA80661.1 sulfatase-like hydrolase/transferase [Thermoanaerobaculales bacterium]HQL30307.1 sulfatase-like hydrolase/transferase [Thermoanaerobaculales bacterium]HQN95258.1 sulfatase-like hydrolase/transferase [Thermoanaerobaculales bacterium]HQP42498.1 sulfatase-like hydrolase/transferase [Thermoanaerobaculales bacterium]